MAKCRITQKQLKRLLYYDPETGIFTWRVSRHNTIKVGARAGYLKTISKNYSYWVISIGTRNTRAVYSAAFLAWLYMTGKWPRYEMDHKNRNPMDDRFNNLREATRKQNGCNRIFKKNKTGAQNIYFNHNGYYCVQFNNDRKTKYFGSFKTLKEALVVRDKAALLMHKEFSPF